MIKPVAPDRDRVDISDIRAKLEEIAGETHETAERAKPVAIAAGAAGLIVVVGLAFLIGRRRGRRKSTWVEIRRQ
jgi:hypothetical protein